MIGVIAALGVAWLGVATCVGILLGRAVRLADHMENETTRPKFAVIRGGRS